MVDPDVELVLLGPFVADATVVVRRSGDRRKRVAVEEQDRRGIEPRDRDPASGERVAGIASAGLRGGRRRIEDLRDDANDRLGEDALTLKQRRDRRNPHSANELARALIVGEEERSILQDRTAEHEAELVPTKDRFVRIRGGLWGEEVPCVE